MGHRNLVHASSVDRLLDHLDEGIGSHIPLKLVSDNEAGVVVHDSDHVVVAPANDPEVGGVCGPHLVWSSGLTVELLTRVSRVSTSSDYVRVMDQRLCQWLLCQANSYPVR